MSLNLEPDPPRRRDPLAALWRAVRPLRPWIAEAACADLDDEAAAVFTAEKPDPDALAVAEATCWRCPVRQQCADYAADGPVWGLWERIGTTGRRSDVGPRSRVHDRQRSSAAAACPKETGCNDGAGVVQPRWHLVLVGCLPTALLVSAARALP